MVQENINIVMGKYLMEHLLMEKLRVDKKGKTEKIQYLL